MRPQKLPCSPQPLRGSPTEPAHSPPGPKTAHASQETNRRFPSPKYPKPQSALVFGALLFVRQERGESRARWDQALHALPFPAPKHRQLCPQLPACQVLPAQPLPQQKQAAGRRGGMANRGWRKSREHGLQLVSPQTEDTVDNQEGITQKQRPGQPQWSLPRY